ncbi:MAG: serine acetyltransferase [Oscillospiraceae bacterium]|nr:serine acetyltransferase [Oscillospiraceae bacterium]
MDLQKEQQIGLAAHLEEIAGRFTDIGTSANGEKFIGLDLTVEEAITHLLTAMFPYHFGKARERFIETEKRTWELMRAYDALNRSLIWVCRDEQEASDRALELIDALPGILQILKTDIRAGYEGDPAAKSIDEVILTYPAFQAISIYRMAHKLYEMQVPLVPRMMTEYAHRITGIDIHPGATIGPYFFIDHGTGVVIGETTTIGEHVKLYQHVTLGAKSFEVGEDGTLVKGIKRHPDIGDRVVIYAGATILGGNTKIGDDCVIGGSVWLTHSLPAGETITIRNASNKDADFSNPDDYSI